MRQRTFWRSLALGSRVPAWAGTAAVITLVGAAAPVGAQATDLAPTDRLRVAVDAGNAGLATKDPASGEWRGIFIDLSHALAQRLGVPIAFVEYAGFAERDAPAAASAWDVASDSRPPEEAAALGWSTAIPYLDVDNTLVVGPNSSIRSIADMDRPGVRIAVPNGTAAGRALSGLLRQAELVRTATPADLLPLLRAGEVDALASNRANVLAFAAQVPGSRVLADRFAVQQQRLTLAPGRSAASVALASDVTRRALAGGLIRDAITRYGIQGVQPSPPDLPGGLPRTGGAPGTPWAGGSRSLLALALAATSLSGALLVRRRSLLRRAV